MASIGPTGNQPNQFSQNRGPSNLEEVNAETSLSLSLLRSMCEKDYVQAHPGDVKKIQSRLSELDTQFDAFVKQEPDVKKKIAMLKDRVDQLSGELRYYNKEHPDYDQGTKTSIIDHLQAQVDHFKGEIANLQK